MPKATLKSKKLSRPEISSFCSKKILENHLGWELGRVSSCGANIVKWKAQLSFMPTTLAVSFWKDGQVHQARHTPLFNKASFVEKFDVLSVVIRSKVPFLQVKQQRVQRKLTTFEVAPALSLAQPEGTSTALPGQTRQFAVVNINNYHVIGSLNRAEAHWNWAFFSVATSRTRLCTTANVSNYSLGSKSSPLNAQTNSTVALGNNSFHKVNLRRVCSISNLSQKTVVAGKGSWWSLRLCTWYTISVCTLSDC